MIVSINQPAYLPWLGYFERIAKSDLHIVLDHVQFEKNSMTNRNRVRTPQGWSWLTVPVCTKGHFGELRISELEINDSMPWSKKHWRTLEANYSRAPFFLEHASFFEQIFRQSWPLLLPLISEINHYLLQVLGINTQIVSSSELMPEGKKADLILELCRKVDATEYISGPFGRDYLDLSIFERNGIEVFFHDYPHPEYRQNFQGFEPSMSVIDLLFNHGPDAYSILKSPDTSLKKY